MRSSNPLMSKAFSGDYHRLDASNAARAHMTVDGTISKTLGMLFLLIATAGVAWFQTLANPGTGVMLMIGGGIGAFITVLVAYFAPSTLKITAPLYAALEGLALGAVSAFYNQQYPGIALQAVALTSAVLLCMLALYRFRIIKVTEKLRGGIIAATMALMAVYLIGFIASFFISVPLFGAGPIGIIFSLVVVGIAAFNLLLDFDFIERGAAARAPKNMEWMGALGFMVTLVWLYMEILRLLSKLASRD